jgi:DNA replication protein DnaC
MKDDLEQLLRSLHLRKIAEIFDEEAERAEKAESSYQEFIARLLRAQWQANQEAALTWRIKRAGLPEQWTLESFPFKRQPGVNQRQIRTFAELEFVPKAENIVFIGPTGVGKTGLASALLLKALQNGHRGVFMRAQDLFDEMYASIADRSTRRLLNRLAKVDVLVIDEMGYLNLRPEQTNIFFKLMEERYRQRATIITTNLDYSEWAHFLGNKALVGALLSRLRHQCHTVKIDGPSLRGGDADSTT